MLTVKPLVMRFGAMGDMVLLIPLLKVLHQRYGQPCDLVTSGAWTRPLMQRVPACGSVHLLTSRRALYLFNCSQWQFAAFLRQRPPGPVYVFESDEKSHSLLRRGGVKSEWICTIRDLQPLPGEHIVTHALRLAHQTPIALRNRPEYDVKTNLAPDARPFLSDEDRADCVRWIKHHHLTDSPLVLIQAGNKKTMKGGNRQRRRNVDYWSEANWGEVIARIREHLPASRVIICGTPPERPLAEGIVELIPGSCSGVLIATDDLPIPRLLALQEVAHSMISVNTGPAHSAAAMGCPIVVMFTRHAHRAADLYAPVATTAPVKILFPVSTAPDAGLDTITPAEVVNAWVEMVTPKPNSRPNAP